MISCHFEVSSGITSLDASLQWQISYSGAGGRGDGEAETPVTLVIDTQIEVSPASQISAITAVTKVRNTSVHQPVISSVIVVVFFKASYKVYKVANSMKCQSPNAIILLFPTGNVVFTLYTFTY